jgi:DnaJ-class molecular chaperone
MSKIYKCNNCNGSGEKDKKICTVCKGKGHLIKKG